MTVQLQIRGAREVAEMLKKVNKKVRINTEAALSQIGAHLQNQVKDSIKSGKNAAKAFDTGFFHDSTNFAMVTSNTVNVFSDAEYGKYLEFGTSRMAPRPHFRNTLAKEKKKVGDLMKDAVKNAI